jgi:hypothetical protein
VTLIARRISTALGLVSAVSTLAVAGGYVVKWLTTRVYREDVPQYEYFFVTALIAVLAVVEAGLALRRSDILRVFAMPVVAGTILIAGIGASIGFFEPGYWLLLTGAVGLLAAVFAAAETPRRVLPALLGLVAALPVSVALGFIQRLLR